MPVYVSLTKPPAIFPAVFLYALCFFNMLPINDHHIRCCLEFLLFFLLLTPLVVWPPGSYSYDVSPSLPIAKTFILCKNQSARNTPPESSMLSIPHYRIQFTTYTLLCLLYLELPSPFNKNLLSRVGFGLAVKKHLFEQMSYVLFPRTMNWLCCYRLCENE